MGQFLSGGGSDVQKVDGSGTTGSVFLPSGTTAERDANPAPGFFRFNKELGTPEYFDGTGWVVLGGAVSSPLVQQIYVQSGVFVQGNTALPLDNTVPVDTEGVQMLSASITPIDALNVLEITITALLSSNNAFAIVAGALFKSGTVNALAASWGNNRNNASDPSPFYLRHRIVAGNTNLQTFNFRGGTSGVLDIEMNGRASVGIYGGVAASSIKIEEVLP